MAKLIRLFNLSCDILAASFSVSPTLTRAPGPGGVIPDFDGYYELTGLVLTSTLLNFSTTNPLGVFVIIGKQPLRLSYSNSLVCPVAHVTFNNSLTGPPVVPIPTNKSTPVPFAVPYPLLPKTPIALYTFGDTTAGNRAAAYLSLQLTPGISR